MYTSLPLPPPTYKFRLNIEIDKTVNVEVICVSDIGEEVAHSTDIMEVNILNWI